MVPRLAENKNDPLPTPVLVHKLEAALSNHPNTTCVSELCNIFRHGAHIGFHEIYQQRLSDVVSANLAKEVLLGHTAGPFDTPPFPNFQVSPIGLVPKKNSNKFRSIFHLSYLKSGSNSINSNISKEDFSLQYVTIDDAIKVFNALAQAVF